MKTSAYRRSEDQTFRNIAGAALGWSSLFMAVVAVFLNSSALFYMATALIATLGATRLQAWLSVKALRFERISPPSVQVGDLVTVQITVWSERKIRRPLVTIADGLPRRMVFADLSPSLPIAPAYDVPIETQYQFRPMLRGSYHWSGVVVQGTDALGLVTMTKRYPTDEAHMLVLPKSIPLNLELPSAAGWGISEAISGNHRGSGVEPRGVREYAQGDSLRYVHWRSSARSRTLLVKEFEAGTNAAAAFLFQRNQGTNIGKAPKTTLEAMISNAVFLAEVFLRQGAGVMLPLIEDRSFAGNHQERMDEILRTLAMVDSNETRSVGEDALAATQTLPAGSSLFVFMSIADESLIAAAPVVRARGMQLIPLLYDATYFADRKDTVKNPACDPAYFDALRASGAMPVVVDEGAYIG